jgi:hypothetical protein
MTPVFTTPLPQADRIATKSDRLLRQELERAVNLLRKAEAIHEVGETVGQLDDPTREALRKLRTKARSLTTHAIEEDRRR